MTLKKKHYELIANSLRSSLLVFLEHVGGGKEVEAIMMTASCLADRLKENDPKFDGVRFLKIVEGRA